MGRKTPKVPRIRDTRDFDRIFSDGRRFRGRYLTLVAAAPRHHGVTRAAFVASRKVGNAVERNRLKRRLREAARRLLVREQDAADFVVVTKPGAAARDYWQLGSSLADLLQQAGIIEDKGHNLLYSIVPAAITPHTTDVSVHPYLQRIYNPRDSAPRSVAGPGDGHRESHSL